MEEVTLRLRGQQRAYPIRIAAGLLGRTGTAVKALGTRRAFLIYDRRLARPAATVGRSLRAAGLTVGAMGLPAVEATKDLRKTFAIYSRMIAWGADRHTVLVALGGGVIGDLAGFIAATYLRGIRWVGLPTTLLAQVDSSIGGKTGVNHPLGKNLIGAFHQPSLVLCDTATLRTLGPRDRVSGLGEIIKYALVFDPRFFAALEKGRGAVLGLRMPEIGRAIASCARWKARVVGRDELETTGERKLLNFGHTLGHALESATGYRVYRHGEAVIWGMRLATALSLRRGHLGEPAAARIDAFLGGLPVPAWPRSVTARDLKQLSLRDKKARDGRVDYVLLDRIGHAVIDRGVSDADIAWACERVRER